MPSSSTTKQTEEALDEVLRTIREDYANPFAVLCETDRKRFVDEEERLRKQLKETIELESNWRGLLGWPSSQALKCLRDAQELSQRVKEDIQAKLRTRLTGKSNPLLPFRCEQGPAGMGGADPTHEITSPLNMRCSLSEPEFLDTIFNTGTQQDHVRASDTNEATNSTLEISSASSDQSSDSSGRRHRRSPPPPPPRRMIPSNNSHSSSESSSSSDSDSPRRRTRRPAPPPPQSPRLSRTPRPPTNVSFPSPGSSPLDPPFFGSISSLTQQADALASSSVNESPSRQVQGGHRSRRSDHVYKSGCVEITGGSDVIGLTVNNGGSKNSGAVVHKTVLPPSSLPQHVPPL